MRPFRRHTVVEQDLQLLHRLGVLILCEWVPRGSDVGAIKRKVGSNGVILTRSMCVGINPQLVTSPKWAEGIIDTYLVYMQHKLTLYR